MKIKNQFEHLQCKKRPLIIVLTHNRPEILNRCIKNSVKNSKTAKKAIWLVIDDSNESNSKYNATILRKLNKNGLEIFHLTSLVRRSIFHVLRQETTKNLCNATFEKTFSRDISGLRNLGLIYNIALKPIMTFLIDDDIVIQKHSNFFDSVVRLYKKRNNFIVGTTFGGVLDESYFGRLSYACNIGISAIYNQDKPIKSKKSSYHNWNPLWLNKRNPEHHNVSHTSGGLLAFKLNEDFAIPFPSGYNEDWIWCLLQNIIKKTKIFQQKSTVIHLPPTIYQPDPKGLVWEQCGEIIFESLQQALANSKRPNIKKILQLALQTNVYDSALEEMNDLSRSLQNFLELAKRDEYKKKIRKHLQIINIANNSLKSLNIHNFFNSWFYNFDKRRHLFSIIFNRNHPKTSVMDIILSSRIVSD